MATSSKPPERSAFAFARFANGSSASPNLQVGTVALGLREMRSNKANSDYPEIPAERRKLMLAIFAGDMKHFKIITSALHFLDCHFPPAKLDAALELMVKNNWVGARLVEFMASECEYSFFGLQKELLERLAKSDEPLRILAGKDFRI